MYKKYDSSLLSFRTESQMVKQYFLVEQENSIVTSLSAEASMDLIMDYMQKRINEIDEARKILKSQYPELLH